MNKQKNKSGFTLIELMMAALAFSILALATGSMLVFGWQGWKKMNDSVDMQRDASLAMYIIAREVRKSTIANITVGDTRLECISPNGEIIEFTVMDGNLTMAVDGTFAMHLVRGQATSLKSEKTTDRSVELTLNLMAGRDPCQIVSTIYARN